MVHRPKSLTGDIYGISKDGVGTIVIDPVKAFGTARKVLANFKVELVLSDSAANINEVLYKVYNLENGDCQDVTRADLLNGKMGTIETDYTKFTGYSTPISDVIIWTEITNDVKYATTHVVLRKIPAKGQTFTMGSPESEIGRKNTDLSTTNKVTVYGRETQHDVTFTKDFYMGVFEVTQYQYWKVTGLHFLASFVHRSVLVDRQKSTFQPRHSGNTPAALRLLRVGITVLRQPMRTTTMLRQNSRPLPDST